MRLEEAAGACPAGARVEAALRDADGDGFAGGALAAVGACAARREGWDCVVVAAEPGIYQVYALVDGAVVSARSPAAPEVRVFGAFGTANRLVAVTACDDRYYPRLANLVGSLHFWEPAMRVDVYDLGLAPGHAAAAEGWANVAVRALPARGGPGALPVHFYDEVRLVGWKFWVVLDALDRNDEVRAPRPPRGRRGGDRPPTVASQT